MGREEHQKDEAINPFELLQRRPQALQACRERYYEGCLPRIIADNPCLEVAILTTARLQYALADLLPEMLTEWERRLEEERDGG